jgi:hypothetical protein
LYFSDKKQTPASIKAFSKRYLDRLSFGEVRSTDELTNSFQITSFPTLLALTDPDEMKGDAYTGEMKVDQIQKFLSGYSYKTAPKRRSNTGFFKMTQSREKSHCSGSKLCLILFVTDERQVDEFKSLAERYETDPIHLAYLTASDAGYSMRRSHF